jgi:hypothetical protein
LTQQLFRGINAIIVHPKRNGKAWFMIPAPWTSTRRVLFGI